MIPLETRAQLVFTEAWSLLPAIKRQAHIADVLIDDLGAVHGQFSPETSIITLNYRLFDGPLQRLPMLDIHGNDPPRQYPYVSRALHTAIHEASHAIGYATQLDVHDDWLRLSRWQHAPDDPVGTGRYVERRPGWECGPSDWRYQTGGTFFPREYSSRNPYEDFADCVTHACLQWFEMEYSVHGHAKLAWLRRHVWGETGTVALTASRDRWRARLAQ